jgi:hypothetical protein
VKVARVAATRPAAASGLLRQARFTSIGWRVGRSRHRKPALHPLSTRCSGAGAGEVTRRQGRRLGNAGGGEGRSPSAGSGSSRTLEDARVEGSTSRQGAGTAAAVAAGPRRVGSRTLEFEFGLSFGASAP